MRQGSDLAPGLVACGPDVEEAGVSAALIGPSPMVGALCRLEAPGGLMGTGVHVGAGYLLTARHVADAWRPDFAWHRWRGSSRRERFDAFRPGWSIVYTPPRGSFAGGPRTAVRPEHAGRYNDWLLLHAPEFGGAPALWLRRASKLARGERVWLVGEHTGSAYRVTTATFERTQGVNGWLSGCGVDTGFAGGPAIDVRGRMIGIVVAMMPDRRCLLVTADTVLDRLERARASRRELPVLPGPTSR